MAVKGLKYSCGSIKNKINLSPVKSNKPELLKSPIQIHFGKCWRML